MEGQLPGLLLLKGLTDETLGHFFLKFNDALALLKPVLEPWVLPTQFLVAGYQRLRPLRGFVTALLWPQGWQPSTDQPINRLCRPLIAKRSNRRTSRRKLRASSSLLLKT